MVYSILTITETYTTTGRQTSLCIGSCAIFFSGFDINFLSVFEMYFFLRMYPRIVLSVHKT